MGFGLSKWAVLVLKRDKIIGKEVVVMPDGQMMKCTEKGFRYKHLGILEGDRVRHKEMKEQTRKEY